MSLRCSASWQQSRLTHIRANCSAAVVVDLLVRGGLAGTPLSDADAMQQVWSGLVRRHERSDRGTPDARQLALLRLADLALRGGNPLEVVGAIDPTALDGLRHEGLLRTSRIIRSRSAPSSRTTRCGGTRSRVSSSRGATPLDELGVHFQFAYQPGRVTAEGTDNPRVQVTTRRKAGRRWTWPSSANIKLPTPPWRSLAWRNCAYSRTSAHRRSGRAGWIGRVEWPARLEVLGRRPLVGAVTAPTCRLGPCAGRNVARLLSAGAKVARPAISNDKDVPGIVRVLRRILPRCS